MKSSILFILLLTYLISIAGQSAMDTTRFRKEIPTYTNGEPNLFFKLAQQKVKQLKIDTLQNGFDSLQIRIWHDYSLWKLRKLLVITRANHTWTATAYTMTVDWNDRELTEIVNTKKIEILNPKNGWNDFLNKLFTLKITELPNMHDIPGLEDGWMDGITYNVEVATKKHYRFYGYHLPDKFQDDYWQAKNMVDILRLVESEFGIYSDIK